MIAPPRTPERLLAALGADTDFRDALIGDLAEEFALRAERGDVDAARRWYYREAIRATPHLLHNALRRLRARDVGHLIGVVLTSYIFLLILGGFVAAVAYTVTAALGVSLSAQQLPWTNPLLLVANLAVGLVTTALGGYFAAWLDSRAPLLHALAFGVLWSGAAVVAASATNSAMPVWYRCAVPIVIVLGATGGGVLRVRGSSHFNPQSLTT